MLRRLYDYGFDRIPGPSGIQLQIDGNTSWPSLVVCAPEGGFRRRPMLGGSRCEFSVSHGRHYLFELLYDDGVIEWQAQALDQDQYSDLGRPEYISAIAAYVAAQACAVRTLAGSPDVEYLLEVEARFDSALLEEKSFLVSEDLLLPALSFADDPSPAIRLIHEDLTHSLGQRHPDFFGVFWPESTGLVDQGLLTWLKQKEQRRFTL